MMRLFFFVFAATLSFSLPSPFAQAQDAGPAVQVQHPESRDVTQYLLSTGTLSAVNQVDLVARSSGLLEKVNFADGASVAHDDILFVIEQEPYRIALATAEAELAQQQAGLAQASANLARQKGLQQKSVVSASTLEDAIAQNEIASAQVKASEARVRSARLNLQYTEIRAPFDGILSARLVDAGAYVNGAAAQVLATLVQPDPLYVDFTANERQVIALREAMLSKNRKVGDFGATVRVEVGLAGDGSYPHSGELDYIAPAIDSGSGTIALRARIANPDRRLSPGMFVRVRVPAQVRTAALVIPEAAIGNTQEGRIVLVVDEADRVALRRVTLGEAVGDSGREIVEGLTHADRVIVAGAAALVPGDRVSVAAKP